jgi:flagellum-specific ATP synthase
VLDQAIAKNGQIEEFLCQEIHDNVGMLESLGQLTSLFG